MQAIGCVIFIYRFHFLRDTTPGYSFSHFPIIYNSVFGTIARDAARSGTDTSGADAGRRSDVRGTDPGQGDEGCCSDIVKVDGTGLILVCEFGCFAFPGHRIGHGYTLDT